MELDLAKALCTAIQNEGFESEIRENYSGRGMYGETTTGIIIDDDCDLVTCIINQANLFVEDFNTSSFKIWDRINQDSMGLQIIYY